MLKMNAYSEKMVAIKKVARKILHENAPTMNFAAANQNVAVERQN